jgi:hypothetical protein
MRWIKPRKIAQGNDYFVEWIDYDGPCVYELGTGGPRGGNIEYHYVGETECERRRILDYASHGSHLRAIIDWHLRKGWCLYYRAIACQSKREAKRIQDNLLSKHKYDWNIVLNRD